MKASASLLALVLMLGVAISCKLSERLGSDKNTVVNSLWPDVPPFAGATKTDLQLPWAARLIIGATSRGKLNFIAFRTDKTMQEVKDFYSKDRMKAAGWTVDEKGWMGDAESKKNDSTVCLFSRRDGGKEEGLAIALVQDEKLPETNIFYARIDLTK
jgi:hypothetical protein